MKRHKQKNHKTPTDPYIKRFYGDAFWENHLIPLLEITITHAECGYHEIFIKGEEE